DPARVRLLAPVARRRPGHVGQPADHAPRATVPRARTARRASYHPDGRRPHRGPGRGLVKFGLFFQAPEAPGQSHAERYAEMIELIGLAARDTTLGFEVAWLAELHFGGAFSLLSNPLMAVPVIAQRAPRIRIGTAVTLLPLHHPLACAEHAATD